MDLSKITDITLDLEGSFVNRIEFWENGVIVDFKEVGKAVSFDEYKKALQAWEKHKGEHSYD